MTSRTTIVVVATTRGDAATRSPTRRQMPWVSSVACVNRVSRRAIGSCAAPPDGP